MGKEHVYLLNSLAVLLEQNQYIHNCEMNKKGYKSQLQF